MPGQYRYSLDRLPELLDRCCELGIKALLLLEFQNIKMKWQVKPITVTELSKRL